MIIYIFVCYASTELNPTKVMSKEMKNFYFFSHKVHNLCCENSKVFLTKNKVEKSICNFNRREKTHPLKKNKIMFHEQSTTPPTHGNPP